MNRLMRLALLLVAVVPSRMLADEPKPKSRPLSEAAEVFAVFTQDWRWGGHDDNLVMAIWGDGHIVWSENRISGGSPYRSGSLDPKKTQAFLAQMEQGGFFNDKDLADVHFGFDSLFTTILVKHKHKEMRMASWHELAEVDENFVATSYGLIALDKRKRLEELKKEPAEYLYFRTVWNELRLRGTQLIPAESRFIEGRLRMKAGVVTWEEWPNSNSPEPKAGNR